MKSKLILIGGIVVLLAACGQQKTETTMKTEHDKMAMTATAEAQSGEKLIYYTCPMDSHKHVHSHEAGTCTECGMKLVAGVVTDEERKEYYGCPMEAHSHVRSDQPGSCEGCGMKLKPMRLVKS